FVHELVRHLQEGADLARRPAADQEITLEEVLWRRADRLPEPARRLLGGVAGSGPALPHAGAARAARPGPRGRAPPRVPRTPHPARSTGPGDQDEIEPYHDRIRETVAAHLPPATLRAHHQRLAVVLAASGRADPETLAVHFHGAGDPVQASLYY